MVSDAEFVINSKGEVGLFLPALPARPDGIELVDDHLVLSTPKGPLTLECPQPFLRHLRRRGWLLIVECKDKAIFKETKLYLT